MPDHFLETPNGLAYVYNGYNRVRRWDALKQTTELAGLDGPTTAPTIGAGTNGGAIIGTFYAYVRFKDRFGYLSNLSPISNAVDVLTEAGSGVAAATNASPVVITTNAAHGLSTGQIVQVKGAYGNDVINDYWTMTVLTPTTFELDGSTGNGVYNSGARVFTGSDRIIYSNVPVSDDPKVTERQILRNRDGDIETFYVDIETDDLTSDTFESNLTGDDLAGAEAVPLTDSNNVDQAVTRFTKPPNHFACAIQQAGRIFAAVTEPYREGCASVTHGSREVTGIGTRWNPYTMVGRTFTVRGETRDYFIERFSANDALRLTEPYEGTTDPYANYVIAPDLEQRRALAWCEPSLWEAWPPANIRQLPEDAASGELTALFPQNAFVYIATELWTYRFSWYKEPALDGAFSLASERGAVNNQSVVSIGGTAYMLDYVGVHAFSGNDDEPISQAIRDLFRPEPNGPYRINWRAKKNFHAIQDPGEGVIRFFVALGGDFTPHHALVCDYDRKRWSVERYAFPVASSCLTRVNGRPQVLYGTRGARVVGANRGTLDGPAEGSGTLRGTLSDSGPGWIEDDDANFPYADIVGFPVVITEGTGRGQMRLIHTATATRLDVRPCWNVRPDDTSIYQIGGIPWLWRSGWFSWTDDKSVVDRSVELMFQKLDAEAGLAIRWYDDTNDDAQQQSETKTKSRGDGLATKKGSPWLDVDQTTEQGRVSFGKASFRDRKSTTPTSNSVEVSGTQGEERQTVWGLEVTGAEQS